jgi:dTDP-4-amino-4,6-dideoxygalactose transaminase
MIKSIPFALPEITEDEINAVVDCMRSGWLTTGPKCKQFEEDFNSLFSTNTTSIAVNSATMGLLICLEAFGVKGGDEVIVPTNTFSATAMMPVHLGARPVFVDINANDFNIDTNKIERAITGRTKAIIPVHFAGQSCNMDEINSLAKKHNIKVLEDAAHALPTYYKGNLIGDSTSDATVFSFYATKTITTGEGGMIVTSDEEIAKRAKIMRIHGISRDVFDRYTTVGDRKWYYEIVAPGTKCNLTDIAASIGIEQLKKYKQFHKRRIQIAQYYLEEFKNLPITLPNVHGDISAHAWHLFVIRTNQNTNFERDEMASKINAHGIGTSLHFIPLHLQPFYANSFNYSYGDFPESESVYESAISLPIYTKLTDLDVEYIAKSIKSLF